jgi:hypothetical protein
MSMAQTVVGIGALALAGHVALNAVLPAPPAIEVHGLTYRDGMVHQSRTIRPPDGHAVAMTWVAEVSDAETGIDVPGCHGNGANVYRAGTAEAIYPLSAWVGNISCIPALLEPGREYVLQAAWISDAGTVYFESDPVVMVAP